jgi:ubiquinone/menaquinone biosynthesis C-methylase UbiE
MSATNPAHVPHRAFMALDEEVDERTAFFVRFLDLLHGLDGVRASHRRSVELLGVREGYRLLDLGCGTGTYATDVASLVGASGRVVGVDLSAAMIGVARRRAEALDVPVEYRVGDALNLPFPDAVFDGCRVERVLQYLDDPDRALAEMVRVTVPGGRVVASEIDWDTFVCDVPGLDRGIWRRGIGAISDGAGNGWMGRELRRRLLEAGLREVTSEGTAVVITDAETLLGDLVLRSSLEKARDAGAITADETARLIHGVEEAGRAGTCFFAMTLFTSCGQKPEA